MGRRLEQKEDIQIAKRHMKRYSKSLIIRETTIRTAVIKKTTNKKCWQRCGKKGIRYNVGGNGNWCGHCGKQYGSFSKN